MDNVIKGGCYRGRLFYGGEIICILGDIKIDSMDKILDIIDDCIELVESRGNANDCDNY